MLTQGPSLVEVAQPACPGTPSDSLALSTLPILSLSNTPLISVANEAFIHGTSTITGPNHWPQPLLTVLGANSISLWMQILRMITLLFITCSTRKDAIQQATNAGLFIDSITEEIIAEFTLDPLMAAPGSQHAFAQHVVLWISCSGLLQWFDDYKLRKQAAKVALKAAGTANPSSTSPSQLPYDLGLI
ncbi:uncharacterized protein EI90DRAFT_3130699 [Cantharellus anzutake]|uniref:uncharacterized protein n=1 Tax=Cantharellus anzutake TaxID=1750568 RepID=UPI0019048F64|nr:uncharacterized protein EI90DRAFT_3130699 [Cantharellus anzutake]KAF8322909.1 hypothetical protein EI90DRAFT_3130699 [Cantharellus anzutake]